MEDGPLSWIRNYAERIIIGGIFVRHQDLLWPLAKSVIEQEALPDSARRCEVLPAAFGEAIGDYASLVAALGPE